MSKLSLGRPMALFEWAMKTLQRSGIASALVMLALAAPTGATAALSENAVVNFGVPTVGGAENHRIVPDEIRIADDGIVNFIVSGFHQVTVYSVSRNTRLRDLAEQIVPGQDYVVTDRAGTTILDTAQRSAANPISIDSDPNGRRLFIEAAASGTARTIGVYFPEPGTYLVICAVKGHLDDAMIALVTVSRGGSGD